MRNTKEKALETRGRILDAAEDIFYEKGLAGTSLSDIASRAKVTRGAIYWHFENKTDLFDAMCERVFSPAAKLLEEMAESNMPDPLNRLFEIGNHIIENVEKDPHYKKVLTILLHRCELLDENDPIRLNQKKRYDQHKKLILRILKNAQDNKQLHEDVNLELADLMIRASFDGILSIWLFNSEQFELASNARRIRTAIIDSIKTSPHLRNINIGKAENAKK